jgi:hypothetical protein
MEAARKEVEEMATRLAQEKPTVTMWKSPPTTALFLGESLNPAGKPGETPAEDKKKGYYEETPNETYLYLQQELAHRQAALKGLEAREQSLRESIEMTKKEQEGLREEAARYNAEKKILLRQSEALTRGYDLLADKLRQAEIAESEQKNLVDLKLVANPVMPDRKVAPMRTPIVFTAALLGFILSSLAVVIRRRLQKGLRMKVEG